MVLVARCSTVSVPASENSWLTEKCGSTFNEDFDVLDTIGRGRFAKVCRVRHRTSGGIFAAKIIRRWRNGKDTIDTIANELRVLELGSRSPHITCVHQCYVRNQDVVMVLEQLVNVHLICQRFSAIGGDLYHLVQYSDVSPPVDFVRSIVRQVLKAVSFLHEHNVVHLDIKPDNVLLRRSYPDCDVVLCDFGLAKYLNERSPIRDLVGTPDYTAPEILDYNPIQLTTDICNRPSAVDCFSDDWFIDTSSNVCPSDASALIDFTPEHSSLPETGSQQSPSAKCELTRPELDRSFGEC
ncbi:serine/threonine kinase 17 [Paragonimus westermani]|uniref:Serine/threonine kinase 17 n=1 Tax=Paragonimus westermani TaxID=34504 RepID=A0A5J4NXV6_9TREM|nr:serine/threonine kinase 17 [Paragonimus westermani]